MNRVQFENHLDEMLDAIRGQHFVLNDKEKNTVVFPKPPRPAPVPVPNVVPTPELNVPTGPNVVLPTGWNKNLPRLIGILSAGLGSFGVYFQTSVMNDPAFVDQFGNWANVPGWISIAAGVLGYLSSELMKGNTDKKFEKAVDTQTQHLEVVKQVAEQQIAEVAVAPAVVPPGEDAVLYRLKFAASQAVDDLRLDDLQIILDAFRKIGNK